MTSAALWLVLQMHVTHKAGMGVGVVLLIAVVGGVVFVGYHFYTHSTKPFNFHYFKVRVCQLSSDVL